MGFGLQDRASTDAYLEDIINRWEGIHQEPNPLVKQEALATLRRELDDLNARYRGKKVRWRFKTALSPAPPSVVVQAPGNFAFSTPGVSYAVSSGDRIDNLRGMILGGVTRLPVPPRLIAGRDISEEDFRKLKGGEEFLVEGTIQELRYPSLRSMEISPMIDVYIYRAKIMDGPF